MILLLILISCNQEKIKSLEAEISRLNREIIQKDSMLLAKDDELHRLDGILLEQEMRRTYIKQYTNSEIIRLVKEDREFNYPEGKRRNFIVRMIDKNRYEVRFDMMSTDCTYGDWEIQIFTIVFLPGHKYSLSHKSGPLCF